MSCTAQIAFGVDIEDIWEMPWAKADHEDPDFEKWFLGTVGISSDDLWARYYEWEKTEAAQAIKNWERLKAYEAVDPEWRVALNDYHQRAREALTVAPVETIYHGYPDSERCQILAVKGTEKSCYLGDVLELEESDLWLPDPVKIDIAKAFCAHHEIPFERPRWLLSAWYSY